METRYHATIGGSVTDFTAVRSLLLLRVRAAEIGPSRPILRRGRMSEVERIATVLMPWPSAVRSPSGVLVGRGLW